MTQQERIIARPHHLIGVTVQHGDHAGHVVWYETRPDGTLEAVDSTDPSDRDELARSEAWLA
jgi:hypothetical protein